MSINTYPMIPSQVDQDFLWNHVAGARKLKDTCITYVNGIKNSSEDCKRMAEKISSYHGFSEIYFIADESEGLFWDLVDSANLLYFDGENQASQDLTKLWRELFAKMGGLENENSHIIHYCHSKGGLTTARALKNLTDKEKRKIDVYVYGSPADIGDKDCRKVTQIINARDPIPFFNTDHFGLSNIDIIESKESSFFDHSMSNTTYMDHIAKQGDQFVSSLKN